MVMLIPRRTFLLLVASVTLCVTFGQQYKGKGCGSKRDPCDGYYCANGGVCILEENYEYRYRFPTPTCQCTGDWTGERCDDNPCVNVECNTGTCYFDGNGSPHCCCPDETSGEFCENADPCVNVNCNSGTCIAYSDGPSCVCPLGLGGDFCLDVLTCYYPNTCLASCNPGEGYFATTGGEVCLGEDVCCGQ